MGRLAGLSASEVIRKLRVAGFTFDRMAKGSHEIWFNHSTRSRVTVPNHPGDLPGGAVCECGPSVDEFLSL